MKLGHKDDDIRNTAIGYDSSCSPDKTCSLALGYEANANNEYSIAIGGGCISDGRNSLTIGGDSHNNSGESISIGTNNRIDTGEHMIIIGHDNSFSDAQRRGIIIGNGLYSNAQWTQAKIIIGDSGFSKYFDGTNWQTGSDLRDKINVNPINNSLEIINSIEPIKFNYNRRKTYSKNSSLKDYDVEDYKNKTKADKEYTFGFSAQSVAAAIKKYYGDEQYGGIITHEFEENEDAYYMTNEGLIPFLVGAIQEQQKQIDELKTKLEELRK